MNYGRPKNKHVYLPYQSYKIGIDITLKLPKTIEN